VRALRGAEMFAVEIPGDVHEFDGIERAAAVPRRHGGVRGFAMEEILDGDETAPRAFARAVRRGEFIADVRTEDDVDVFEISGADVEGFCGDKFFRDAGKDFDSAGEMIFLHLLFQDKRGGYVDGHAGVVTFAVARRAFDDGIVIRDAGFLRGAWDTVFIRDKGDDGFSAAVRRDPRCGNSRNSLFGLEAIFLEDASDVFRGFDFLEAEFAKAENLVDHLLGESLQLVSFFEGFVLQRVQGGRLLSASNGQ